MGTPTAQGGRLALERRQLGSVWRPLPGPLDRALRLRRATRGPGARQPAVPHAPGQPPDTSEHPRAHHQARAWPRERKARASDRPPDAAQPPPHLRLDPRRGGRPAAPCDVPVGPHRREVHDARLPAGPRRRCRHREAAHAVTRCEPRRPPDRAIRTRSLGQQWARSAIWRFRGVAGRALRKRKTRLGSGSRGSG
jgi:hypothetical protein